eukprot:Pgem_evm1s6178
MADEAGRLPFLFYNIMHLGVQVIVLVVLIEGGRCWLRSCVCEEVEEMQGKEQELEQELIKLGTSTWARTYRKRYIKQNLRGYTIRLLITCVINLRGGWLATDHSQLLRL